MSKVKYRSSHRSVFNLTVHIVFVTKYRRKIIDAQMLTELKTVFESGLKSWNCKLIEFNSESEHCHLIVSFPPQKRLSDLVGNLKATASKTMWRKFESKLSKIYHKKLFWTGSYFIASFGGVTVDTLTLTLTLKQYVQNQNSPSHEPLADIHERLCAEFTSAL